MFEGLESWGRAFATILFINRMAISSFDSYTNSGTFVKQSIKGRIPRFPGITCSTELEGSTCTVSWSNARQGHLTGDFHDPPTMTGLFWKWRVGRSPFVPIALAKLHAKPGLKDYSHGGSLKKESVWLQSGLRNGLFTCWRCRKKMLMDVLLTRCSSKFEKLFHGCCISSLIAADLTRSSNPCRLCL